MCSSYYTTKVAPFYIFQKLALPICRHICFTFQTFVPCKLGKNGWFPCILCWKAVGTLGTNCRWRCPHLRMSGITHSTHAVRYQVRDPPPPPPPPVME